MYMYMYMHTLQAINTFLKGAAMNIQEMVRNSAITVHDLHIVYVYRMVFEHMLHQAS